MDETFERLREIMLAAAPAMTPTADGKGGLVMLAPWPHPRDPKKPMWFGAVTPGKAYIGYHLMPVYSHPQLMEGASPELKKRMQGKSCFNFRKVDPALFEELADLTRRCAQAYAEPLKLP